MFERILVPLDGSASAEQALPYARALAAPGAELVLVRAVPSGGPAAHPDREVARRQLDAAAAALRQDAPGVRVEAVVASGPPESEILRLASEWGSDLVAMASRGRRGPAERVLGSVADGVAAAAGVPVLVVRAGEVVGDPGRQGVRRLLVPLDGSASGARVLALAEALAVGCSAPIHLLAAVDPADAAPPGELDADVTRDALAKLRAEAQNMLELAGAGLLRAGLGATWQLESGRPADAIVAAAGAGDVILLASRGRGGGARWPLGSVAARVLRYAPAPVLLLHTPT